MTDNRKTYLIIGPAGHGKSTTANKLTSSNDFTTGNDITRVTTKLQIEANGSFLLIDTPGFGDVNDEEVFLNAILDKRQVLLNCIQINAFLLVIKFDLDKSHPFYNTALNFVKCFGSDAIRSLVIVCIQGNLKRRNSTKEFSDILISSPGYNYLKEKNNNYPVEYCLWDNFQPYPQQDLNLSSCVQNLNTYSVTHLNLAFDMMQTLLEYTRELNLVKRERDKIILEKDNIQNRYNKLCFIYLSSIVTIPCVLFGIYKGFKLFRK